MDGLFHGKPYFLMDDLRVFPYFWISTHMILAFTMQRFWGYLYQVLRT